MSMTEETKDLSAVWMRTLQQLSSDSVPPQHRAFLRLTEPKGLIDDTALIAAPDNFTKQKLETDLRALVSECLSRELGRSIRIAVTVDPSLALDDDEEFVPAEGEFPPRPWQQQHG